MHPLTTATITEINDIFTVFSPKGRHTQIQNRACYGLSFCKEGKITYTLNGKQTISDQSHAILLPQGQTYDLFCDKTGIFPVINFSCSEFLSSEVLSFPIQYNDIYFSNFEKMKALSLMEGNRAKIMSIFYDILHQISLDASLKNMLIPAINYIETNYRNPKLTNAELARICNISEIYFRKTFTDIYKITPKQYIIDLRINHAKQLLAENRWKVTGIAELCGFSNPYHFCRLFKEKTGVTPTQYAQYTKSLTRL